MVGRLGWAGRSPATRPTDKVDRNRYLFPCRRTDLGAFFTPVRTCRQRFITTGTESACRRAVFVAHAATVGQDPFGPWIRRWGGLPRAGAVCRPEQKRPASTTGTTHLCRIVCTTHRGPALPREDFRHDCTRHARGYPNARRPSRSCATSILRIRQRRVRRLCRPLGCGKSTLLRLNLRLDEVSERR